VKPGRTLPIALLALLTAPLVGVYLWMALASVNKTVFFGFSFSGLTLAHWGFLSRELPYAIGSIRTVWPLAWNTFLVGAGVALIVMAACSLGGYSLSRLRFRGRAAILQGLMALRAFPMLILLIATYFILSALGLLDTFLGVILTRSAMELTLATWVIKGFFDDVPREVEEAAMIDGASPLQLWWHIMLRLIAPGLAAVGIIAFRAGWSDFVFVTTFLLDESKWTLSNYVYTLLNTPESLDRNFLSAVSLFYMVPVMALYALAQKAFARVALGVSDR
jgi:inositol-phosphate transport system permease protein